MLLVWRVDNHEDKSRAVSEHYWDETAPGAQTPSGLNGGDRLLPSETGKDLWVYRMYLLLLGLIRETATRPLSAPFPRSGCNLRVGELTEEDVYYKLGVPYW